MSSCRHLNLVLLPRPAKKLRCRHCHLTIAAEELGCGYCPECFDASGKKSFDFEEVNAPAEDEKTRYRCEDCGAIIDVD
jgi:LSD1 subclass zinc finger protein